MITEQRHSLPVIPGLLPAGMSMSARPLDLDMAAHVPCGPAVTVYPNPFKSYLNVQVAGASNKPMIISIRSSATGAIVQHQTVTYNGPVTMYTSSLPAGGYLITVPNSAAAIMGRCESRKQ